MRIEEDVKLDFKDVLIRPKRSTLNSRSEVNIQREFILKHSSQKYNGIPIIAANMDTVGTITMAKKLSQHEVMTALHKHYPVETLVEFFNTQKQGEHVFYSTGILPKDLEKFAQVYNQTGGWDGEKGIKQVCVDVANGYTQNFVTFLKKFREQYPNIVLMAGNVVTGEMTEELIISGVDIVKVGIGPGSACTTRKMTGVGYPQLSAVVECADAAHGLGGHICSDGGCVVPGDLSKAFGAGADFVMLGGMLAGHDECEAEVIEQNGKKYIKFYGMSSKEAMDKHHGGVANYRASEGKSVLLDYRGTIETTIKDILGGVRSSCTYVGAKSLKELSKRTTFIRVTQQLNESLGKS